MEMDGHIFNLRQFVIVVMFINNCIEAEQGVGLEIAGVEKGHGHGHLHHQNKVKSCAWK